MPFSRHEFRENLKSAQSRLGQSLIHLHSSIERTRQEQHHVEGQFLEWQENWSNRRDQISERLESIESQLEGLTQTDDSIPRLSIVGLPSDA